MFSSIMDAMVFASTPSEKKTDSEKEQKRGVSSREALSPALECRWLGNAAMRSWLNPRIFEVSAILTAGN
jgi:hypothetical protein